MFKEKHFYFFIGLIFGTLLAFFYENRQRHLDSLRSAHTKYRRRMTAVAFGDSITQFGFDKTLIFFKKCI